MRRHFCRALAAVMVALAIPVAVVGTPGTAGAEGELDAYGWWFRAQTPIPPDPNIPTPPTIQSPPSPVVPAEGMLVGLGPINEPPDPTTVPSPFAPFAVAAVRFLVPEGSDATVSLPVGANYDADGPAQNPQPVALDACVPDSSAPAWDPNDPSGPGRWEGRPTWDCDTFSVPGAVEEDGTVITWQLPSQFQQTPGVLDLILVPRGTTPFSLGLDKPTTSVLTVTGGLDAGFGEGDGSFEDGSFDPAFEDPSFGDDGFADPGLGDTAFGPLPEATGPGAGGGAPTARPEVPFRPAVAGIPVPDTRGERILAVALLLGLAAALWWFGGRPSRSPRLLGSLAGGTALAVPSDDDAPQGPLGGIGRFVRPRTGRPTRLG